MSERRLADLEAALEADPEQAAGWEAWLLECRRRGRPAEGIERLVQLLGPAGRIPGAWRRLAEAVGRAGVGRGAPPGPPSTHSAAACGLAVRRDGALVVAVTEAASLVLRAGCDLEATRVVDLALAGWSGASFGPVHLMRFSASGERLLLLTEPPRSGGPHFVTETHTSLVAVWVDLDAGAVLGVRPVGAPVELVDASAELGLGMGRPRDDPTGIRLYRLDEEGAEVARLDGPVGATAEGGIFSSDGRRVLGHFAFRANPREMARAMAQASLRGEPLGEIGNDGRYRLYDAARGELLWEIPGGTHPQDGAAFSPCGQRLVTWSNAVALGSSGGLTRLELRGVADGAPLCEPRFLPGVVWRAAFSSDGGHVEATGPAHVVLRAGDLAPAKARRGRAPSGAERGLFPSDLVVSPAPSPPQLVHPTLGWPRVMAYALPGNVSALELSRDGGAMVVASAAADAVRVFDLRRGVVRAAGRLGKVHGVLRAEGTLEVVPHEGRWRAQVAPWTTPEQAGGGAPGAPAPPRIAGPPVDLRNLPTCVDFTLDPPLMALVWRRSHVQLHGPGEDEPRWVHHSGVRSLVPLTRLLPGGERLLLAWRDGAELVVQLLDTRAVELVLAERLDGRAGAPVEPLASWASADGRRAWVRDSSGVVALDVAAGALLSQARSDAFTRALALHPDGEHLARLLEDGRLRLERREDGEVVAGAARSLDTPAMAFGPTGRDLYVAEGGFVRALDADQLFAC